MVAYRNPLALASAWTFALLLSCGVFPEVAFIVFAAVNVVFWCSVTVRAVKKGGQA